MPHKDPVKRRAYANQLARKKFARLRAERRARLDAAFAARPPIPVAELAWAAGHFEGEGTVTICRSGAGTASLVTLTSTNRDFIDFFHARWPAYYVREVEAKNPRHRTKFVWTIRGEPMLTFLCDIQPYLVSDLTKRKVSLAIHTYRERVQGSRAPDYQTRMHAYRDEMRELNRKGPRTGVMPTSLLALPAPESA